MGGWALDIWLPLAAMPATTAIKNSGWRISPPFCGRSGGDAGFGSKLSPDGEGSSPASHLYKFLEADPLPRMPGITQRRPIGQALSSCRNRYLADAAIPPYRPGAPG